VAEHEAHRSEQPKSSWWARRRNYFLLMALAIGTMQWALKQLSWLFGWKSQPVQGHFEQIFDALVILAAGTVVMIQALRHLRRHDAERQVKLDRLHEKAANARAAREQHA